MNSPRLARRPWTLLLLLVLLASLLVHLPGLRWGYGLVGNRVPYVQLHPDEPRFVEQSRALAGEQEGRATYVLALGQAERLYASLRSRLTGQPTSDAQRIGFARACSLAWSLVLVLMLYLLVRAVSGRGGVGWFAAALVGLNTLVNEQATYGTTDMAYAALVYAFAYVAWLAIRRGSSGRAVAAAAIAGAAMSMKFGVILLPSVLLLGAMMPRKKVFTTLLCMGALLLVFEALQGFAFGPGHVTAMWASFTRDNVGGFHRNRWWIPLVYLVQMVRAVGLPVFLLAMLGAAWAVRGRRVRESRLFVPLLPVLLHAAGILAINTTFPRHLLLLVPVVAWLAAVAVGRLPVGRLATSSLVLLWTLILTLTDAQAVWFDRRGEAMKWLAANVSQNATVWADPYFKVPVHRFFRSAPATQCDVLVFHEGWTYRFERSELSPLAPPVEESALYHAAAEDLAFHRALGEEAQMGHYRQAFIGRPPAWLPEQVLYRELWGNFNKFAGTVTVYSKTTPAGP